MNLSLSFVYQKLGQIKPRTYCLIGLFIFCLPAFMVNIKHTLDWGDDYAQYLSQAEALLHGKTAVENGYIYQDFAKMVGPKAYPQGFPLLLTIPLSLFGYNIPVLLVFISLIAMSWFWGICKLFKNKVSLLSLAAIVLFTFYNGEILSFKAEILSEIPYAAASFWALYFIEKSFDKKDWKSLICAVLLTVFSILIRSVGWVLVPAILIQAVRLIKNRKILLTALILWVGTGLLYVLVAKLIFPAPSEGGYEDQLSLISAETLLQNSKVYPLLWGIAFTGSKLLVNRGLYLLSAFVIIMVIIRWLKKPSAFDAYFLIYLAVFIFWPYTSVRFFIPVFPFYLFYLFWGLEKIIGRLPQYRFAWPAIGIGLAFFFVVRTLIQFPHATEEVANGPFTPQAQEMFTYLHEQTPANSGVLFAKPRLLSWETKRKTLLLNDTFSQTENEALMQQYGIEYALVFKQGFPHQEAIEKVIYNNSHFSLIKENETFELYKWTYSTP